MSTGKRWGTLLLVLLWMVLPGCTDQGAESEGDFVPGETVSTYWFEFTVEAVTAMDSYDGYRPEDGNRLMVCRLSLENTFDDTVSMTQTDFFLLWEDGAGPSDQSVSLEGMVGTYALPKFARDQMEDNYDLPQGEKREGDLVFEVPETVDQFALVFEEYYVDGESEAGYSVGDHYAVWFTLEDAENG